MKMSRRTRTERDAREREDAELYSRQAYEEQKERISKTLDALSEAGIIERLETLEKLVLGELR